MKIFPLTNPNTLTNYKIDGAIPQLQVNIPVYEARNVTCVIKNPTSAKCSWVKGSRDKCVVFAKENGTGTASPENNITYSGSKVFGPGTQIGSSGWYCVYNGDLDTATISNLKPGIEYRFHVIEYSGAAGAEIYSTAPGINNPVQYMSPFTEAQIVLTGISGRTNAWGDYDNDGDLDLVIGGYTGTSNIAEIYKNNGDNTFTKAPVTISNTYTFHDLQWGDYDNDGDLDLLALSDGTNYVYENKGDGTFTDGTSLPTISGGTGQWADLDNDGYKDIIFTNMAFTRVLKNNKDKTFSQAIDLPGVSNSPSLTCGDYDNDGDLDVLLAGLSGSKAVTIVFRNDGDFVFTEQTGITLPGISNCAVEWADMDNDGDLDIVMSGSGYNFYTKIFDNNGNNTFTEIAGTPFKELYRSSLTIGDYDNDGYRDLIISGSVNGNDYYTILYRNNGNKTYSEVKTVAFPGIQYGSLNLGDYDNDNDLDLFICGITATGRISKVFRNNIGVANAKPPQGSDIWFTLGGNDLKIYWYKGYDTKTGSGGLSYNLYVYETSKSIYAKSGEAYSYGHGMNGRKLVASFGDIQYTSAGYLIKGLPSGDYNIAIQAVDAGMLGGNFSNEKSFSILDLSAVSVNVAKRELLNTKSGMGYCTDNPDDINTSWYVCYNNITSSVDFKTGGFDVWVHQSGNAKNRRKVATILPQVAAPVFTINYTTETTVENIPSNVEYKPLNYNDWMDGSGKPESIGPGRTFNARFKATATTVASADINLEVPARPLKPQITIDYFAETTAEIIPSSIEYSPSYLFTNATSGTGTKLPFAPGQTLHFRYKSTENSFKSDYIAISVPSRSWRPYVTFDYIKEITNRVFTSEYEYSDNENMTNSITCNGSEIPVIPGQKLCIRKKATSTSYSSEIETLNPYARPVAPTNLVVFDIANLLDWSFVPNYLVVSDYEYSVDQGVTWSNCTSRPLNVGNIIAGSKDQRLQLPILSL